MCVKRVCMCVEESSRSGLRGCKRVMSNSRTIKFVIHSVISAIWRRNPVASLKKNKNITISTYQQIANKIHYK